MKYSILFIGLLSLFLNVSAQVNYFFEEGTEPTFYDQGIVDLNSLGTSVFEHTSPPCCPTYNDKMPCTTTAYKGSSALKFNYTSNAGGDWTVSIFRNDWSAADLRSNTELTFYVYSAAGLPQSALPKIGLRTIRQDNNGEDNSVIYNLSDYNNAVPAGQWTQLTMPLDVILSDVANSHLNFSQVKAVVFKQSETNGVARTFYVDEIAAITTLAQVDPVQDLTAAGYDSHVELNWTKPAEGLTYRIEASFDGGNQYELRGTTANDYYMDFVREKGSNLSVKYRVTAASGNTLSDAVATQASTRDFSDEELIEMVQQYTWRYFWDHAHPTFGLIRERSNDDNPNRTTSGGTGMGLMALIVGHERNFAPPSEIKDRIVEILTFLDICPVYHGAFSHWYNGATGQTIPFSPDDDGGDIVETSFVAAGLIALKNHFTGTDAQSEQIRQLADQIWKKIEWNWYRQNDQDVLYWHWSPNVGWKMNHAIHGFNETLVTYILAASSPTYSIPATVYHEGWANNGTLRNPRQFYGYNLNVAPDWGGPMFWIHYTHLGLNPHQMRDQYTDYWTECVNVAKIHHAYSIDNPKGHLNYSDKNWGLTASDQPQWYSERRPMNNDIGTIAPTAALGSFPYTPQESMKALKYFYQERGADLFGPMGFYDAFNDNESWVAESYLAIDQGPILIMLENYRSGLLWNAVMKDADVKAGLQKLGFENVNTSVGKGHKVRNDVKVQYKESSGELSLSFPEELEGPLNLDVYATDGALIHHEIIDQGGRNLNVNLHSLSYGIYVFSVISAKAVYGGKFFNK